MTFVERNIHRIVYEVNFSLHTNFLECPFNRIDAMLALIPSTSNVKFSYSSLHPFIVCFNGLNHLFMTTCYIVI